MMQVAREPVGRSSFHTQHLLETNLLRLGLLNDEGLWLLGMSPVYKHVAPLGLRVGQDDRPTGVVCVLRYIALR